MVRGPEVLGEAWYRTGPARIPLEVRPSWNSRYLSMRPQRARSAAGLAISTGRTGRSGEAAGKLTGVTSGMLRKLSGKARTGRLPASAARYPASTSASMARSTLPPDSAAATTFPAQPVALLQDRRYRRRAGTFSHIMRVVEHCPDGLHQLVVGHHLNAREVRAHQFHRAGDATTSRRTCES